MDSQNEPVTPAKVLVRGQWEGRSFIKDPSRADAKERIDGIGENLAKMFDLKRQLMRSYRELWKIYLADCKRFGVEPRKADISVM